jgi:L-ascorbate metabolism protein UlaG (beta-lactamase superfamily)
MMNTMLVRFIAHAGISIEEDNYCVLIDPWFLDSTPEYPVIESIGGGFKTIDFQIPKTQENIERYKPDVILVSHFHPHHSPHRDITMLCQNSLAHGKQVILVHAETGEREEKVLRERVIQGVDRRSVKAGDTFTVGPFTIEAKQHTAPVHQAWHVRSKTGSVVHIGDGMLNRDPFSRKLDDAWTALKNLSPSILFLSTGGHNVRVREKNGDPDILAAGIFSPVEAAKVAQVIAPRAVAPFGFYNHSIWKNRLEYINSAPQTEEEFQWAISWLAPRMKNIRLIPGQEFGIGDVALKDTCDFYLTS